MTISVARCVDSTECNLRGVYSDTTQVSRVFVYDVMSYKLSQLGPYVH